MATINNTNYGILFPTACNNPVRAFIHRGKHGGQPVTATPTMVLDPATGAMRPPKGVEYQDPFISGINPFLSGMYPLADRWDAWKQMDGEHFTGKQMAQWADWVTDANEVLGVGLDFGTHDTPVEHAEPTFEQIATEYWPAGPTYAPPQPHNPYGQSTTSRTSETRPFVASFSIFGTSLSNLPSVQVQDQPTQQSALYEMWQRPIGEDASLQALWAEIQGFPVSNGMEQNEMANVFADIAQLEAEIQRGSTAATHDSTLDRDKDAIPSFTPATASPPAVPAPPNTPTTPSPIKKRELEPSSSEATPQPKRRRSRVNRPVSEQADALLSILEAIGTNSESNYSPDKSNDADVSEDFGLNDLVGKDNKSGAAALSKALPTFTLTSRPKVLQERQKQR